MGILENIAQLPRQILQGLQSGGGSVLGVDIGSSSIKVVQLRKEKGRAILETYGELALGPYAGLEVGQATNLPVEKLSEALRDIMREANVTTKRAAFSIPLNASITSVISLPTVSEKDLASMVPIEARKYIPVPISEVTLDFWVIPRREREAIEFGEAGEEAEKKEQEARAHMTDVLLVAIHNSIINKYERIAASEGLRVAFLEIETFSAIRALISGVPGTFVLLDVGASATNVAIVEGGIVYRSHVISHGSQDITIALSRSLQKSVAETEELKRKYGFESGDGVDSRVAETADLIMGGVFSEVNRVLLEHEKKEHKTIDKVVLTGGGSLLKGMLSFAKNNLENEVVYAHPFSKVETPAFLENILKEIGPSFSVSLGVALRQLRESE